MIHGCPECAPESPCWRHDTGASLGAPLTVEQARAKVLVKFASLIEGLRERDPERTQHRTDAAEQALDDLIAAVRSASDAPVSNNAREELIVRGWRRREAQNVAAQVALQRKLDEALAEITELRAASDAQQREAFKAGMQETCDHPLTDAWVEKAFTHWAASPPPVVPPQEEP